MKKVLFTFVILGNFLLMAENIDTKKTMQALEVSMGTIQKGLLYNHRGILKKGIESLKEEIKNIDSFIIKNDESLNFNAKHYAETEVKALTLLSSKILEDFDSGKKEDVMIAYEQILNRCVTCHKLIRKW